MAILREAAVYAEQFGRDRWDFAVDVKSLVAAGCNLNDLRWLLCAGFALHGIEIRGVNSTSRQFKLSQGMTFGPRSCFVLAQTSIVSGTNGSQPYESNAGFQVFRGSSVTPTWDQERRELRLNDVVVKSFKLPSPNQEAILTALAEEHWPARIDDPLPPHVELDPKRRLHDTIKSLNRNQKHRLIRFSGDGTGEGVLWKLIQRA
ncbi:MAG TPA: hypothetical protein VMF30_15520 [Pirellulales bacterium]|nr:hypothetical protein [Pirellulales bacterium]